MKTILIHGKFFLVSLILWIPSVAFSESLVLGHVGFEVETNVKMFCFKGVAQQLQAKVDRNGSVLKSLELNIPVSSLKTGMEFRDQHMREKIFSLADGTTPDVRFTSQESICKPGKDSSEQVCEVKGRLTLRGRTEDYPLNVVLKDKKSVKGSGVILLSAFGIEPPSHAGIRVKDSIHVDFEVEMK